MKTIAINTTPLLSPHTGIARYIYNLSLALSANWKDYTFRYFEGLSWTDSIRMAHSEKVSSVKDGVITKIPFSRHIIKTTQQYFFNRPGQRYHIDLYHEPNYLPLSYKYKTVITIHDLSFVRYPETHPVDRVKILERRLPDAIQKSAAILVDSHFVKTEVIDCFAVDPSKITVHYLAVDDVYRQRPESDVVTGLNQMGLTYKTYLLTVGTLEPRKNLSQTLDCYRQLPKRIQDRYPLVIIGAKGWGDSGLNAGIQKLINSGKIILPGYVDISTLATLYSGAKLLMYPSLYEGFGLPPLEAMASGVPAIVTNTASLPEVVGSAGVLVEVGDSDSMARAVQNLLEDDQSYLKRCELSRQQAAKFSWKQCADVTMALYRQVMES